MKVFVNAFAVRANATGKKLKITLVNGVVLIVPTHLIQILDGATVDEVKDLEVLLDGVYIRWPRLDEDLKVQSLLEGTFGTSRWMTGLKEHLAELGRKGGSIRSEAKTESARKNGAKGGRPRKIRIA